IADSKGGEGAGETGKPEPTGFDVTEENTPISASSSRREMQSEPAWVRWTMNVLWSLALFAGGFLLAWLLFPRPVPVFVTIDPQTGKLVQILPNDQELRDSGQRQNLENLPLPAAPDTNNSINSANTGKKDKDGKQR